MSHIFLNTKKLWFLVQTLQTPLIEQCAGQETIIQSNKTCSYRTLVSSTKAEREKFIQVEMITRRNSGFRELSFVAIPRQFLHKEDGMSYGLSEQNLMNREINVTVQQNQNVSLCETFH